jgi:hypothetical protein
MLTRAIRAAAIAVAVASVSLSACGNHDKPAAVVAAEPESSPVEATADTDGANSNACAEGDIECEERLYQLEETLFAYESAVAKQIPEAAQSCWKSDSDAFRQLVDNCQNFECKDQALLTRIASLHFLQPAEHRASLELPPTPLLLTVLAADSVADTPSGPPDAKLQFEARGSLIHAREHPEHMGIAVRTDDQDHVFLFDMDIGNQPGQDEVLGLVGTSPTSQVLVRGQRRVAPTGVANFDPAQCRWVYELP